MKNVEIVKINWNSLKSVKQAERKQAKLWDKGYALTKTISGINTADLIYRKTLDSLIK